MTKSRSAGGIVIGPHGKILVVDQGGSWSLPKGHIENGEKILDAAKREIYEETGISDLKLIKKFRSYARTRISDPTELKTIFMYLFRTSQTDLKPVCSDSHEALWLNKDKVAKKLTHPKDKRFYLKVLKSL